MTAETNKTTILYIEDSAVEREVVCHILEAEDCEVISTGDVMEGIKIARDMVLDLILLDLHMPKMDGCDLVERLREMPVLQAVPIVAMSASIKEEERAEVYARFDGFVKKPVDADAFPAEVRDFIARGRDTVKAPREESGEKGGKAGSVPEDALEALEVLARIRSILSHDLRSPLTVMISYAGTVGKGKAGELSARQKEMLELVVEQGFEMDELIAELARMARDTLDRYGYRPPKEEK